MRLSKCVPPPNLADIVIVKMRRILIRGRNSGSFVFFYPTSFPNIALNVSVCLKLCFYVVGFPFHWTFNGPDQFLTYVCFFYLKIISIPDFTCTPECNMELLTQPPCRLYLSCVQKLKLVHRHLWVLGLNAQNWAGW